MTGSSIRLFRAFGADVRVHHSFYILPVISEGPALLSGEWGSALDGLAVLALIYVCVILHEFGHLLMARRLGAGTGDIYLLPIGAMVRVTDGMQRPRTELLVGLAGPAVSLFLGLSIWLACSFAGKPLDLSEGFESSVVTILVGSNLAIFAFNMIPIHPMDGGRVLRAVLSMLLPRRIAEILTLVVAGVCSLAVGYLAWVTGAWMVLFIIIVMFLAGVSEVLQPGEDESQAPV